MTHPLITDAAVEAAAKGVSELSETGWTDAFEAVRDYWRGIARAALLAAAPMIEARVREAFARIAERHSQKSYDQCECLGSTDHETGQRECSIEVRGGDCLCAVHDETACEIANAIRAGNPPSRSEDRT